MENIFIYDFKYYLNYYEYLRNIYNSKILVSILINLCLLGYKGI